MVPVGVFSDTLRGDLQHGPRRCRADLARYGYARVGRIARPATPAPRHAPACLSHASWRAIKGGSEAVSTRDARLHAPPVHPSFIAGLLPSARDALTELLLRWYPWNPRARRPPTCPKLSGAEHVRTRRQRRPEPLACWLAATGGSRSRAGLRIVPPLRRRPFAFGPRAAQFASARAPVVLRARALRRRRPGGWETRTS